MESAAIDEYQTAQRLVVPKHAIERAVRMLTHIEALALIRAAFHESDGGLCTLAHAQEIFAAIRAARS